MLQEFTLLYSLFQRMLCHLLIAERNIEHILKKKKKSYYKLFFWLFLLYLFSCIRIFFVGGKRKKNVFFISARTYFFLFVHFFHVKQSLKQYDVSMLLYLHAVCVALTTAVSTLAPPTCPSLARTLAWLTSAVNKPVLSVYPSPRLPQFIPSTLTQLTHAEPASSPLLSSPRPHSGIEKCG